MEWSKAAELMIVYLTPYFPYLVKFGEGFATELGKRAANSLTEVAVKTWEFLRSTIPGLNTNNISDNNRGSYEINVIDEIELANYLEKKSLVSVEYATRAKELITDIRNVIYDTIVDGLLLEDLQELYLRMNVGFDDLVLSSNPGTRTLIYSLLDFISRKEGGFNKLVNAIQKTRPDIEILVKNSIEQYHKVGKLDELATLLTERLTGADLNEVYFRLGTNTNELIRRAKSQALINFSETRNQLPELVKNMWIINPRLVTDDD